MRINIAVFAVAVGLTIFSLDERGSAHLHPGLGRFVQRDLVEHIDGMSLYEYLRSTPTELVDPFDAQSR